MNLSILQKEQENLKSSRRIIDRQYVWPGTKNFDSLIFHQNLKIACGNGRNMEYRKDLDIGIDYSKTS